jgi:hypothetical protein
MRTNCKSTAATYAPATRARSSFPRRCPVGKARKTCMRMTGGRRSSAWPRVNVRSFVVHDSVETKFANPAATISGPKRLSGRRAHASRPHRMYDTVSQFESSAITSGSPSSACTAGFRSAETKEYAAAAQPASAIPVITNGRGGARAAPGSTTSAVAALTAVGTPFLPFHLTILLNRTRF